MLRSMRDLERTWNHKFNYPWTFFNDKPFTAEFKKKMRAHLVSSLSSIEG
jgi:mannosyltransferase